MSKERYMKNINGEKVFCLEYDKETLCDMVLELQQRIDKAIEYIEECEEKVEHIETDILLDILKGSDTNE